MTPPVSKKYFKLENANQQKLNRQILARTLKRWRDVTYVNFEQDSRFCGEDFYDATHLNTQGAEKLTVLLRAYFK